MVCHKKVVEENIEFLKLYKFGSLQHALVVFTVIICLSSTKRKLTNIRHESLKKVRFKNNDKL